jgi:hypothetical protein
MLEKPCLPRTNARSGVSSPEDARRQPVGETMSPLAEFLRPLLREGRVLLRAHPPEPAGRPTDALAVLHEAHTDHRLALAGPPLDFDAHTALAAAELVRHACWFLANHDQPEEALQKALTMPHGPATAAAHLAADLTLRFVPQIHRRARALDPADRLTELLAVLLRQWPLSGVLAGVEDEPLTPPEFDGHPGLLLLYAERWAAHPRPAWLPRGRGFEYLELVWTELGKDPAALPRPELLTAGSGDTQRGDDGD